MAASRCHRDRTRYLQKVAIWFVASRCSCCPRLALRTSTQKQECNKARPLERILRCSSSDEFQAPRNWANRRARVRAETTSKGRSISWRESHTPRLHQSKNLDLVSVCCALVSARMCLERSSLRFWARRIALRWISAGLNTGAVATTARGWFDGGLGMGGMGSRSDVLRSPSLYLPPPPLSFLPSNIPERIHGTPPDGASLI